MALIVKRQLDSYAESDSVKSVVFSYLTQDNYDAFRIKRLAEYMGFLTEKLIESGAVDSDAWLLKMYPSTSSKCSVLQVPDDAPCPTT